MPDSLFAKKLNLLEEFLNLSLFDGFSNLTLQKAGLNIGLDKGQVAILAPDGTLSMVDYWFSLADEFMAQEISKRSGLKIREKATLAIRSRIEFLGKNKEALRSSIALLALPQNLVRGIKIGGRFVDAAWRSMGDNSTDINFYSKRMTLLGVDILVGAYFLGDDSNENIDTWAFLDRRIENIMQFEKAKFEFKKLKAKIPNPIPFLAKLRYGEKPLP